MMDKELAALVNKFNAVQHAEVAEKFINERNVVELIAVLRARGLVDILYTSDGKEYLTWPQLRREILDEVLAHNGRINMCDLPALLNVDLTLIEQAIGMLLREEGEGGSDSEGLRLLGGELLTPQYIAALLEDARDALKEHGYISITDFSRRSQLPLAFTTDILAKSIARGELHALMDDAAIFTSGFVRHQLHLVHTALLAATTPVNLAEFAARHRVLRQLFPKILQRLAEGALVPGRIEGGASGQYIPTIFDERRTEVVTNLYASNGFVTYAALQAHNVADPRAFMAARFNPPTAAPPPAAKAKTRGGGKGGGRHSGSGGSSSSTAAVGPVASSAEYPRAGNALSACFLADRALSELVIDLEAVIAGDVPLLDIADRLPSCVDLTRSPDEEIVVRRFEQLSPALSTACVRVAHSVYVNVECVDALRPQIASLAREDLARKAGFTTSAAAADVRNTRKLLLLLAKALGVSVEDRGDALAELLTLWDGKIGAVYRDVGESMAAGAGGLSVKKLRASYQARALAAWGELLAFAKALPWLERSEATAADAVGHNRHLLATCGTPIVAAVLLDAATDKPEVHAALAANSSAEAEQEQQQEQRSVRQMLAAFPAKEQKALLPLVVALEQPSVASFVEKLEKMGATGEIGICFNPLGKKAERELSAELRRQLWQRVVAGDVAEEEEAGAGSTAAETSFAVADAFGAVAALALHQRHRILLKTPPGKLVPGIVAAITAEGPWPSLTVAQAAIVELLRAQSNKAIAAAEQEERLRAAREALSVVRKEVLAADGGASPQ